MKNIQKTWTGSDSTCFTENAEVSCT